MRAAEACKGHLRERADVDLALVEEFIRELEGDTGDEQSADPTIWSKRFSDVKRSEAEMLERVDAAFEEWLNPPQ